MFQAAASHSITQYSGSQFTVAELYYCKLTYANDLLVDNFTL